MKILQMIVLTCCLLSVSLLADGGGTRSSLYALEKRLNPIFEQITKDKHQNVYDILDKYAISKAVIISRWFKIASQVHSNEEIAFFIYKTDYKVGALLETMLFSSKLPISEEDYKVLRKKFNFLSSTSQKQFKMGSSMCHTLRGLNFRTLPIVLNPTKKKQKNKVRTLSPNTDITLLYAISYQIKGRIANWGYIETEDRRGWVNLKYTSCLYGDR
jgi:hypothetical protein